MGARPWENIGRLTDAALTWLATGSSIAKARTVRLATAIIIFILCDLQVAI